MVAAPLLVVALDFAGPAVVLGLGMDMSLGLGLCLLVAADREEVAAEEDKASAVYCLANRPLTMALRSTQPGQ